MFTSQRQPLQGLHSRQALRQPVRHGRPWPFMAGHGSRRNKEHDFKSWMGPGPNSENRPRMGSGNKAKHRKSLPNRRQQGAPSTPPKGAALRAAPLGSCCLPFGKDFLCFAAFPEPILGRFSEFGPGPIQDLKSYSFFLLRRQQGTGYPTPLCRRRCRTGDEAHANPHHSCPLHLIR